MELRRQSACRASLSSAWSATKTTPSAGSNDRERHPGRGSRVRTVATETRQKAPTLEEATHVEGSTYLGLDRFVGHRVIGRGGMATVVQAFDTILLRDVAIKVPNPESTSERDFALLAREAQLTAELEHPHIIPLYDYGTNQRGTPFLALKLVRGETLEDALIRTGVARLDSGVLLELLQVFVKVCDAIAYAHSRGFIHRDLKPSNVMLGEFGQVYVIDWGVACPISDSSNAVPLTSALDSELVGTPRYMAPEQLQSLEGTFDERTDVFGLGAILYEVLTGQPPHDPEALADIAMNRAQVNVAPPETIVDDGVVPPALSRIALRAMSHEKVGRYPSVQHLKEEVETFSGTSPVQTFVGGLLPKMANVARPETVRSHSVISRRLPSLRS